MTPKNSVSSRAGLLVSLVVFCLLYMVFGSSAQAQATAAAPEYRLGAGDAVRISVYQSPDLALEGRISESGLLSYPLLGNIQLGGLGISAAERLIADGLKAGSFVKAPQVSVFVTQVRGNQVSVLGQVNRPGRFPIESTDLRLSDLLAVAGGIAAGGADTVVLVGTRNGERMRRQVDLPSLFRNAGREDDMLVLNGDAVYVERAPVAYIYGEVQRPGPLRLERGLTVMQALATGGGLTARGTEKGLRVHRKAPDGQPLVLQPAMDDALRDGDVVYVRESLF